MGLRHKKLRHQKKRSRNNEDIYNHNITVCLPAWNAGTEHHHQMRHHFNGGDTQVRLQQVHWEDSGGAVAVRSDKEI